MTVDNEPITLFEIMKQSKINNISKEEAVNRLVQQKIENIEIQKLNLVATPMEVDAKMKELAKQNGLTYEQFKQALAQEGHNEEQIREQIEQKYKRDKLYKRIIGSKIQKPDFDELKSYYELHKNRFSMPEAVEIIEYLSPAKEALEMQKRSPMMQVPNIKATPKSINFSEINPQLASLLAGTPDGSFTPVLDLGKQSGMFFVKRKLGVKEADFQVVQKSVYAMLMQEREQAVVIEYFEKKKSEANIKVVRQP
jgi:DNA-binding phage protein